MARLGKVIEIISEECERTFRSPEVDTYVFKHAESIFGVLFPLNPSPWARQVGWNLMFEIWAKCRSPEGFLGCWIHLRGYFSPNPYPPSVAGSSNVRIWNLVLLTKRTAIYRFLVPLNQFLKSFFPSPNFLSAIWGSIIYTWNLAQLKKSGAQWSFFMLPNSFLRAHTSISGILCDQKNLFQ